LEEILLINRWVQECKGFERDRELENDAVAIVAGNNLIVSSTIVVDSIRHICRYRGCCCYASTWEKRRSSSRMRFARRPYTDLVADGFVHVHAPKIKDWVPCISVN
jgi:hypothetical protein